MGLEDYYGQTCWCVKCKQCYLYYYPVWKRICPPGERYGFMGYYAAGKLAVVRDLLDGNLEHDGSVARVAYACSACGACEEICQRFGPRLEPLKVIQELRVRCVEEGNALLEHMVMIDGLKKEDNMLEKAKADRGKWAEGLPVKDATRKKADVLYHAGCKYSYVPELQAIARDTVMLLKGAGIDVGVMGGEESCCGSLAYELGYRGEFTKYAESNLEDWRTLGVKEVVTSCAECYGAFRRLYPGLGKKARFEALHITQYLDRLLRKGKLKLARKIPMKVTYHDPCHLGRRSAPVIPGFPSGQPSGGVYGPPREILKTLGLDLVEMERVREYAWCCGSGGGVKSAFPELALWAAAERIEEAKATGAEALVTSCPWCRENLLDAARQDGGEMKVYDLVELVLQAL